MSLRLSFVHRMRLCFCVFRSEYVWKKTHVCMYFVWCIFVHTLYAYLSVYFVLAKKQETRHIKCMVVMVVVSPFYHYQNSQNHYQFYIFSTSSVFCILYGETSLCRKITWEHAETARSIPSRFGSVYQKTKSLKFSLSNKQYFRYINGFLLFYNVTFSVFACVCVFVTFMKRDVCFHVYVCVCTFWFTF